MSPCRVLQLTAVLAVLTPPLPGADPPPDGQVVVRPAPVPLPNFADVPGLRHSATPEEYEEARKDATLLLERFTYMSDGLDVSAYLLRPARAERRPLVVFMPGRRALRGEDLRRRRTHPVPQPRGTRSHGHPLLRAVPRGRAFAVAGDAAVHRVPVAAAVEIRRWVAERPVYGATRPYVRAACSSPRPC